MNSRRRRRAALIAASHELRPPVAGELIPVIEFDQATAWRIEWPGIGMPGGDPYKNLIVSSGVGIERFYPYEIIRDPVAAADLKRRGEGTLVLVPIEGPAAHEAVPKEILVASVPSKPEKAKKARTQGATA